MTVAITGVEGPKGVAFILELENGLAAVEWLGNVVGVFSPGRARWVAEIVTTRGTVPGWVEAA